MKLYRATMNAVLRGAGSETRTWDTPAGALRWVSDTAMVEYISRDPVGAEPHDAYTTYLFALSSECRWLRDALTDPHPQPEDLAKAMMVSERGAVWPGPGVFFQIEVIHD